MAFFNEIGAGRYNRFIQKLFNMKGGPPARQLASDVAMVFPFFTGVEHRYLEQWERFGTTINITGGAGSQAGLRMRNPATSNAVAVIEKLSVSRVSSAGTINLRLDGSNPADFTTPIVSTALDSRTRSGSSLINTTSTAALTGLTPTILTQQIATVADTREIIQFEEQEITILPTTALTIVTSDFASQIIASVFWRERALEDSEVK